jgi:hypothetical protein
MTAQSNYSQSGDVHRTPAIVVAVAWLFVGIPAAWGVKQTFMRSMDLFHAHSAPAAVMPAAPASLSTPPPNSATH